MYLGGGENDGCPTHSFVSHNHQQRQNTKQGALRLLKILNLVDMEVAQWVGTLAVQARGLEFRSPGLM